MIQICRPDNPGLSVFIVFTLLGNTALILEPVGDALVAPDCQKGKVGRESERDLSGGDSERKTPRKTTEGWENQ